MIQACQDVSGRWRCWSVLSSPRSWLQPLRTATQHAEGPCKACLQLPKYEAQQRPPLPLVSLSSAAHRASQPKVQRLGARSPHENLADDIFSKTADCLKRPHITQITTQTRYTQWPNSLPRFSTSSVAVRFITTIPEIRMKETRPLGHRLIPNTGNNAFTVRRNKGAPVVLTRDPLNLRNIPSLRVSRPSSQPRTRSDTSKPPCKKS